MRRVAIAMIESAVKALRAAPPPIEGPPQGPRRDGWRSRWRDWLEGCERDVRWFSDPTRSAWWCEAAGLDWDFVVGELRRQGLLELPSLHSVPAEVLEGLEVGV